MTVYEDVKAVLNQAASSNDTGMVILDYLQTVSRSIEEPSQESYVISKRFGHFLRKYGEAVMVPVVVFAQIRESKELALKDRIQNDKTILDHAFQAIEIVPDFETKTTTFKIHKDRHGSHQGKECIMRYVDGRYEPETAF